MGLEAKKVLSPRPATCVHEGSSWSRWAAHCPFSTSLLWTLGLGVCRAGGDKGGGRGDGGHLPRSDACVYTSALRSASPGTVASDTAAATRGLR